VSLDPRETLIHGPFEVYPRDEPNRPNGWCVTFPNGWEFSVAWGMRLHGAGHDTVEVCIFPPEGASRAYGYCDPTEVARLMAETANR
jgi:hypothetical protein